MIDRARRRSAAPTCTRGVEHFASAERPVGACLAPTQDRLHHHDRAVDDDAEIDRAEREQVRRDVGQVHQDEGNEHRQRDDDGDDQRAARAAEEQDQDDQDQRRCLRARVCETLSTVRLHQVRAVEVGDDPHALAAASWALSSSTFAWTPSITRDGFSPCSSSDDALDRVGIVVLAEDAVALTVGLAGPCRGRAPAPACRLSESPRRCQGRQVVQQADAAHDIALFAARR